jgi:hypothetical protein
VSGSSPVGTVTWSASEQGAFSPTSCTLSSGLCLVTYTPLTPGTVNVTAYYSSDANNAISFASLPLTVAGSPGNDFPILLVASVAVGVLGIAVLFVGLRSRRKPGAFSAPDRAARSTARKRRRARMVREAVIYFFRFESLSGLGYG